MASSIVLAWSSLSVILIGICKISYNLASCLVLAWLSVSVISMEIVQISSNVAFGIALGWSILTVIFKKIVDHKLMWPQFITIQWLLPCHLLSVAPNVRHACIGQNNTLYFRNLGICIPWMEFYRALVGPYNYLQNYYSWFYAGISINDPCPSSYLFVFTWDHSSV